MTEQEWLDSTDPRPMLEFLRGKASDRKLRLLACAYCRRAWGSLAWGSEPEEMLTKAVAVAEFFADGLVPNKKLGKARSNLSKLALARRLLALWFRHDGRHSPDELAHYEQQSVAADWVLFAFRSTVALDELMRVVRPDGPGQEGLVGSLRCLFGSPFRRAALEPSWLAWNDGTVVRLAHSAYEERSLPEGTLNLVRLAVLADALEDAGCADPNILAHLRGPRPHVRGCWVVDLLLSMS
jgi:hypothetical protein